MNPYFYLFLYFGFGALSSFIGAITGLGGGFILIPVLTMVAGLDIKDAIFLSLASILWLSILRVHQNRTVIRQYTPILRRYLWFVLAGSATAAYIGSHSSSELLNKIFVSVLICLSLYFFWDQKTDEEESSKPQPKPIWGELLLFLSGSLGGLLGIGGGIITVPTLHKIFRFPMFQAVKLSFPFAFVSTSTALLVYFSQRKEGILSISPFVLLVLLAGTYSGSQLASKVKISSSKIKLFFAIVIGLMGAIKLTR